MTSKAFSFLSPKSPGLSNLAHGDPPLLPANRTKELGIVGKSGEEHGITKVWMQAVFQTVVFPQNSRPSFVWSLPNHHRSVPRPWSHSPQIAKLNINQLWNGCVHITHSTSGDAQSGVYHLSYWSNVLSCCLISDLEKGQSLMFTLSLIAVPLAAKITPTL